MKLTAYAIAQEIERQVRIARRSFERKTMTDADVDDLMGALEDLDALARQMRQEVVDRERRRR